MSEEGQPRRTVGTWFGSEMDGEDPANHILINGSSESQVDLIGNLRASPSRIALFHLDNRADQIRCWPFRTGLAFLFWGKQQTILALHQHPVKTQKRRWLESDRHATKPSRFNPERTESSDYPVQNTEIWGTPTGNG